MLPNLASFLLYKRSMDQFQTFLFTVIIFLAPLAEARILLSPGQNHKIQFELESDIHISNGKIIHMKDTGTELIITALKVGTSAISAGKHNWLVEVVNHGELWRRNTVKKALKDLMGLKPLFHSTPLSIIGTLYRLDDLSFLARQLRGAKYQLNIQIPPNLRMEVRDYIRDMSQKKSFSTPQVQFDPHLSIQFFHLEEMEKEEVKDYFSTYGFPTSFSQIGLKIEPLIEIKILIAEVHKSLQKQIGTNWGEGYRATLLPRFSQQLELTLQALESKGQGQILASPRLLCRSGSKAEFLAGGEFPIKIFNYKTNSISWKRHGVHLSILPKADNRKQLSVDLSTEISLINNAQSVDGLPGLKTNRLHTYFDLKEPRTIALSGLIRHDFGISSQGLPKIQSIPIIGKLFGSENYRKQLTELMIFVTPKILDQ